MNELDTTLMCSYFYIKLCLSRGPFHNQAKRCIWKSLAIIHLGHTFKDFLTSFLTLCTLTGLNKRQALQSEGEYGCKGGKQTTEYVAPSTQEGAARVVPATCPGKQEHLTVCDRSSILFLLQHRWRATTSHVPVLTWWAVETRRGWLQWWDFWMMLYKSFKVEMHKHCQIDYFTRVPLCGRKV